VTAHVPGGMPVLGRGGHPDPTHGACLMEATALIAGEPHSDRPHCVHPFIAAVARIINDAVSDSTRQRLALLAPACATTATTDPRLVDELVILVCQRALPVALPIWAPALRRALRIAGRRIRTGDRGPQTAWQLRRAEAAVRYATASIALAAGGDRDDQLTALLVDCLAVPQPAESSLPAVNGYWSNMSTV